MHRKQQRGDRENDKWRPTKEASSDSKEAFKFVSEYAKKITANPNELSHVNDLWHIFDAGYDCKESLEKMSERNLQVTYLGHSRMGSRQGKVQLQKKCSKLIDDLPDASMHKHEVEYNASQEDRWEAVAQVASSGQGEVRLLDANDATERLLNSEKFGRC